MLGSELLGFILGLLVGDAFWDHVLDEELFQGEEIVAGVVGFIVD